MKLYSRDIVYILLFLTINISISQANSLFKSYDVRSAVINYEINGSGTISGGNYLDIHGKATLIFDEWGVLKLYKEKYIETTTGAIKDTNVVRKFYMEDSGVVSQVDFKNKKIEKSKNLIIEKSISNGENLYQKMLKEMNLQGSNIDIATILGYQCDVWLYRGKKRYLYKGVPLKEESTISGIAVTKVATSIEFDNNISKEIFVLPDFKEDEQKGFLMEEDRDTHAKNIQKVKEIVQDEISNTVEVNADNIELNSGIEHTEDIFHKQKLYLPKLLREMQESRVCLENAEDRIAANACMSKLLEIEEKMNGEKSKDRVITLWTNIAKEKTIDELEESIMDMQRRMPCIRSSQNIDDLSECMRSADNLLR